MTGRELIAYILQNNLENAPVFENGSFIGFMNGLEAASKYGVGVATIETWCKLGMIEYFEGDNGSLYFRKDTPDPRLLH